MAYSILIVDDDEITRDIISEYLKTNEKLNILTAKDGESALRLIEQKKIHIMLLDISMPGMNGIDVLKETKKIDPLIQVIMITAFSTLDRVIESLMHGAIDYLTKPFKSPEELRRIVNISVERLDRWKDVLKYTAQNPINNKDK